MASGGTAGLATRQRLVFFHLRLGTFLGSSSSFKQPGCCWLLLVDGNFYTVSTSRKVGLSVRCHAATIAYIATWCSRRENSSALQFRNTQTEHCHKKGHRQHRFDVVMSLSLLFGKPHTAFLMRQPELNFCFQDQAKPSFRFFKIEQFLTFFNRLF